MASRRDAIQRYYQTKSGLTQLTEKAAAAGDSAIFHGPQLAYAVVVRSDLNGYSDWARDRDVGERAGLLDEFFTLAIPRLVAAGGVFFRDEGDCIIGLFSNYFRATASFASAEAYALVTSAGTYGTAKLSAKSTIACGSVAIYQKAHEVGTDDWSAEGEPFVRSARLEQALASKAQVAYFADDYATYFDKTNVDPSSPATWTANNEKLQVPGLGAAGGWTDVVICSRKN